MNYWILLIYFFFYAYFMRFQTFYGFSKNDPDSCLSKLHVSQFNMHVVVHVQIAAYKKYLKICFEYKSSAK